MKIIINSLIIIAIFITTSLSAKNGYNYYYYNSQANLPKTAIVNIATHQLQRLILKKKIPSSWKSIKHYSVNKTQKTTTSDWVVIFKNHKIKNKKAQTLYIFVDTSGTIKGMNYTGH